MDCNYGEFVIDDQEFCRLEYKCDPELCKDGVCCAVFDIAITFEERDRIETLLDRVKKYCPWLEDGESPFQLTPCELFIRKRPDGLCWFNYRDSKGRCWCALHSAALEAGENPFKWKPLNCSLWPFLRDGMGRLEVDTHTKAPCLRINISGKAEEELISMLEEIVEGMADAE